MSSLVAAEETHLTYVNVALAFAFIGFDAVLSLLLGLGIGTSLVVSALRCVVQLSAMSLILDKIFAANNIWGVIGIALTLNLLSAFEAVFNKAKRRFANMFPYVLLSFVVGTIPVSVACAAVMQRHPLWRPEQYVPALGMLLGNAISAVGVSTAFILREMTENKDKIETYLAMGASRFEASRPVAREAIKMALLPTINQMSIVGLVSIPGLMTGAILGGSSVDQAAKLQMIILFCISASSALSTLAAGAFCLTTVVDGQHRLRPDRIVSKGSGGGLRGLARAVGAGSKRVGGLLGGRKRS